MRYILMAICGVALAGSPAHAGEKGMHHHAVKHMHGKMQCKGKQQCKKQCKCMCKKGHCNVSKAYDEAFARMHKGMDIAYSGQVDSDFARGMIPHHQGAVDMAQIVLRYGKDPEIKAFAEWVILAQEQEIARMQNWLYRRGAAEPSATTEAVKATKEYQRSMEAMARMHSGMAIDYTGDADLDFVRGMIPHHQGAIDMANIEITSGGDPEMLKLAHNIIASQNQEIAKMQRWLKRQEIK